MTAGEFACLPLNDWSHPVLRCGETGTPNTIWFQNSRKCKIPQRVIKLLNKEVNSPRRSPTEADKVQYHIVLVIKTAAGVSNGIYDYCFIDVEYIMSAKQFTYF
jgi:hypothetical protein